MAKINFQQLKKVSALVKKLPDDGQVLNFYSFGSGENEFIATDMYPTKGHSEAINFFFFICLHQFGFWYGDDSGYVKPLIGLMGGKTSKGSDLLWRASLKALNSDIGVFQPKRLSTIEPEELLAKVFTDDNGPIPFPDIEERFKITRMYGRWFVENKTTPSDIIRKAREQAEPLKYFLAVVRQINGFNEDLLEKKNLLLSMTMANRPERFLFIKDAHNWSPITDYHLMRTALRLGLVDLSESENEVNRSRRWVTSKSEKTIRSTVHSAIEQMIHESGRTMSFVDEKMWSARKYCPEMTDPNCQKCIFKDVCKKRTELFQPVFRTTAY